MIHKGVDRRGVKKLLVGTKLHGRSNLLYKVWQLLPAMSYLVSLV